MEIKNLIKEAFQWRYATKKYDSSKEISSEDWEVLKKSLQFAPSSYGVQPWKFFVVENPKVREALKPSSWGQSQVTEASRYIVFTYRESIDLPFIEKFLHSTALARSVSVESLEGFKSMLIQNLANQPREWIVPWAQRQTYIAMGFLLETAALLKIDSTPIEGLDPAAYDKILGIEGTGWKTVAAVALGYRHSEDPYQAKAKVRFAENEIFETIK